MIRCLVVVLAAVILFAACGKKPEPEAQQQQQQPAANAPERYVQTLQNDVKKADEVRDKANAAIQARGEEASKAAGDTQPEQAQ